MSDYDVVPLALPACAPLSYRGAYTTHQVHTRWERGGGGHRRFCHCSLGRTRAHQRSLVHLTRATNNVSCYSSCFFLFFLVFSSVIFNCRRPFARAAAAAAASGVRAVVGLGHGGRVFARHQPLGLSPVRGPPLSVQAPQQRLNPRLGHARPAVPRRHSASESIDRGSNHTGTV